jgi:hypothetical protein
MSRPTCFTNHLPQVSKEHSRIIMRLRNYQQCWSGTLLGLASSISNRMSNDGTSFVISIQLRSAEALAAIMIPSGLIILLPRHMRAPAPNAKKKRSVKGQLVNDSSPQYHERRCTELPSFALQPSLGPERFAIFAEDFFLPMYNPRIRSDDCLHKLALCSCV